MILHITFGVDTTETRESLGSLHLTPTLPENKRTASWTMPFIASAADVPARSRFQHKRARASQRSRRAFEVQTTLLALRVSDCLKNLECILSHASISYSPWMITFTARKFSVDSTENGSFKENPNEVLQESRNTLTFRKAQPLQSFPARC